MTKFLKGFLAIAAAVFAWSTLEVTGSFIFAEGAGPVSALSVRFLIATLLFAGVMLWKKQTTGENLFAVEKEDRKKFLLNGVILGLVLPTQALIGEWDVEICPVDRTTYSG